MARRVWTAACAALDLARCYLCLRLLVNPPVVKTTHLLLLCPHVRAAEDGTLVFQSKFGLAVVPSSHKDPAAATTTTTTTTADAPAGHQRVRFVDTTTPVGGGIGSGGPRLPMTSGAGAFPLYGAFPVSGNAWQSDMLDPAGSSGGATPALDPDLARKHGEAYAAVAAAAAAAQATLAAPLPRGRLAPPEAAVRGIGAGGMAERELRRAIAERGAAAGALAAATAAAAVLTGGGGDAADVAATVAMAAERSTSASRGRGMWRVGPSLEGEWGDRDLNARCVCMRARARVCVCVCVCVCVYICVCV